MGTTLIRPSLTYRERFAPSRAAWHGLCAGPSTTERGNLRLVGVPFRPKLSRLPKQLLFERKLEGQVVRIVRTAGGWAACGACGSADCLPAHAEIGDRIVFDLGIKRYAGELMEAGRASPPECHRRSIVSRIHMKRAIARCRRAVARGNAIARPLPATLIGSRFDCFLKEKILGA